MNSREPSRKSRLSRNAIFIRNSHLPAISWLPFAKKVQNLTYVYVFLPVLLTLTDLSGTMLFILIMIDN